MKIGSNPALSLAHSLQATQKAIARSLERLSSGKRVRTAADDVGAFIQGVRLNSQVRGLAQSVRSINDSLSLIETTSSSLQNQIDLVQKMREIAVQANSGTLKAAERQDLQKQIHQLLEEFNRITNTTEFNGRALLKGGTIDLTGDQTLFDQPDMTMNQAFDRVVGTGDFDTRMTIGTNIGLSPGRFGLTDLDLDGDLDLITSASSSNRVSVFLNNGSGVYTLASTLAPSSNATEIFTPDLNNDGFTDLVAMNSNSGNMVTYLGNGQGKYTQIEARAIGGGGASLAFGDMNRDGFIDMIGANTATDEVNVSLGRGDGTFNASITVTSGLADPSAILVADVTGDGILDIVSTEQTGARISVLTGSGTGLNYSRQTFSTGGAVPLALSSGDFDNDGDIDILASNWSGGIIGVLKNAGNGTFNSVATYFGANVNVDASTVGDFNGDGYLDFAVTSGGGNIIQVYTNKGDGTFGLKATYYSPGGPYALKSGDINGDGVLDLLTITTLSGQDLAIFRGHTTTISAGADVRVDTLRNAQLSLEILDRTLEKLESSINDVSTMSSILNIRRDSVQSLMENLNETESQMLDADFALELAELTRLQILQEVQTAAMAQSNLQLQIVLQLLEPLSRST